MIGEKNNKKMICSLIIYYASYSVIEQNERSKVIFNIPKVLTIKTGYQLLIKYIIIEPDVEIFVFFFSFSLTKKNLFGSPVFYVIGQKFVNSNFESSKTLTIRGKKNNKYTHY